MTNKISKTESPPKKFLGNLGGQSGQKLVAAWSVGNLRKMGCGSWKAFSQKQDNWQKNQRRFALSYERRSIHCQSTVMQYY